MKGREVNVERLAAERLGGRRWFMNGKESAACMKNLIVVRGGGELATGVIHRLHNAGYRVLALEQENPSAIRREIVFAEAVYDEEKRVERVTGRRAQNLKSAEKIMKSGEVAIMVDPQAECLASLRPKVLVDAIYAKRNLGTTKDMAELTIGIGPGFCAGRDVCCVVETMRGHNLGRLIYEGHSMLETDPAAATVPEKASRVIYAPVAGRLENGRSLSFTVHEGENVAFICSRGNEIVAIKAPVYGVLRGLIHDGYQVTEGLKIAEIDPSTRPDNCFTISAKSRCVSGAVLEAILSWERGVRR